MTGLLWTLGVYGGVVLVGWRLGLISLATRDERRVVYALLLVLAGTHSTAERTGAADVAAHPLVVATALRGLLDVLALAIILPLAAGALRRGALGKGIGAGCLAVYLAVAGISTLYSAGPVVTAGKAFELGVGLLVLATAASSIWANPVIRLQAIARVVVLLEAGLLLTAVVGFFVMPGIFSQTETRAGFVLPQTLGSPYAHSNGLSSMGALVGVYAFAELLTGAGGPHRAAWVVLGLLGPFGVVLASGRQGVVIWAASMAVLLWICRRRLFVLLLAPATIGLVVSYWDFFAGVLSRGQQSVTLATWSGRLDFWRAAFDAWTEHPWLGYGFGAGGRFVALERIGMDTAASLHSGYMEVLTGVGVIGAIPLAAAAVHGLVWAVRSLLARRDIPMAILIVPLLLRTLVSDGFGAWVNAEFLLFGVVVLAADEGRRVTQTRRRSAALQPGELANHRLP